MRFLITLISIFFFTGDLLKSGDIHSGIVAGVEAEIIIPSDTVTIRQQPVTFAFLTDLHVSPGSVSETYLQRLVDEINRTNVDFTVVTGDLTNAGSDAELLAVYKALDNLLKPCYVLPGNHETNWSESAGLTFNRLWGNDRFLFNLNGYLFVGFNTGPFMKMGDGFVKQEDLQWLKRQLQNEKLHKQELISFTHYPLSDGLGNWVEVTDLLKSSDCRINFCGHGHRIGLYNFNGIPGIMGRSVVTGNSTIPGYNIVKLRNDSVLIYPKELSVDMVKPGIMLNYLKPDTLSTLPVSSKPDFSVNLVYPDRKIIADLSDSASVFSGPCLVNDTIIIYGNSLGWVKAINTESLKTIWQILIPAPVYSTPVSFDGIIILGTTDGNVIALDALNGKKLWAVRTGRPVLTEGIVENGFVYTGGGDRDFFKIDIRTGKIIWQFAEIEGLMQGKPVISGSSVIFGAWDRHLYCIDKNSGSLKWKWNNGLPQKLYSPGNIIPVCSDNKVFIVAPDRFMTAINLTTGKQVWRTGRHQVRESIGASPDASMVYAKLMNDTVIAMSAMENYPKTLWAVDAGFGYEHSPCPILATSETIIVATRNGMLVAIDPKTSGILWKYKAGTSSINKIVVDQHGNCWFTLTEGKIMGIKIN